MRKLSFLLACMLPLFAQQAQAPVELTSEPHHHLVLDNMFVRVFDVTIAPGESTLMHHHGHDYLGIQIGDAQFSNLKHGAQPVTVNLKDGETRFTPGGLIHAITNTAGTPFHNETVELLQPTTNQKPCTENCSISVPCASADKSACVSVTKLITSDQWSVTLISLPAGAKYPQHTHLANFLTVPLTDADVTMQNQDQPPTVVHSKTGQITWNNPIVHTITNTGKTPGRVVLLEFRGRPSGEGSESMGPNDAKPHEHR